MIPQLLGTHEHGLELSLNKYPTEHDLLPFIRARLLSRLIANNDAVCTFPTHEYLSFVEQSELLATDLPRLRLRYFLGIFKINLELILAASTSCTAL